MNKSGIEMQKDSKIYVAGHRGMVGSALVRALKRNGFENIIVRNSRELDLRDQGAVQAFFERQRPEYVFLAAARVGGIWANNTFPAQFVYDNLQIQNNVIHSAKQAGVRRLLFLGSSCIYPRACPQPMKETYLLTGPLEETNRPYAVAKIAGIEMCRAYNRQYGTQYLAVMPTNLYGPNDNYDLQRSHVLPALIRKAHLAKLAQANDLDGLKKDIEVRGEIPPDVLSTMGVSGNLEGIASRDAKLVVWGTGAPKREFLYSDDMADASVFLMTLEEKQYAGLVAPEVLPLINIGCGHDVTIKELAELVRDVVGFAGDLVWDAAKPDGTPRKLLDVSRLEALGWRPSVDLAAGIRAAYEDYRKGNAV
jgi:GDP-L-fucose synthase